VPVTVAAIVALVAAPAGAGYAAYRSDRDRLGVLPVGTEVGGVDVSGLGPTQAVAAVRAVVARDRDRVAELRVAGRVYRTTPRQLDVTDDAAGAVHTAFADARSGSWVTRTWRRVIGQARPPEVPVSVTAPSPQGIRSIVDRAVTETAVAPVDASARLRGGFLTFTHARMGARLDAAAAEAALRASLADGLPRTVPLRPVAPKVSDGAYRTTLLVRTGENRLYVYQSGQLVRTYPVATGMPGYETPRGQFRVTLKRYRPTWVNPTPNSGWGLSMPAVIPPGPNNPLGTRALNLSAPAIRIHGTPSVSSIGYNASHGCIRMRMRDVEALFPIVPTGAPVFITKAGPARLMSGRVPVAPAAEGG
jgi:lipoprotein-anchoring transpeptidase ErfK/SrfK